MSVERRVSPSAEAAAHACGNFILERLNAAVLRSSSATLAISGGSTPALLFRHLAAQPFHWDRVHLFWVDERAVAPDDERSNYRLARETFLEPAKFPESNVHRVQAERPPAEAAQLYAGEIRNFFELQPGELPVFDVIHRGMGDDAHTASLFPGEPLIDDRQGIATAVYVPKMSTWRITLLPGVLLNATATVLLAAGSNKAEPVRHVFESPYDPGKYPSQLGLQAPGETIWFLDESAARLLKSG